MNSHLPQNPGETVYLGVEALPAHPHPVAHQPPVPQHSAPQHPIPASAIPEWEQHVPPPPIAQEIPVQSIDAASYRDSLARGEIAPGQGQLLGAPQPAYAPPAPTQSPAPQYALQSVAPPAAIYSPFRDDRNAYHTVIEIHGVQYFARELDDAMREHIGSLTHRFIADPAHRIVEVVHGVMAPRPIALEEIEGGEITWYGRKKRLEPSEIYRQHPELSGHLQVRFLSLEEMEESTELLVTEHPTVFEKYLLAQETMQGEVIFGTLTGWSIAAPFTLENVQRLTREVKRTLFIRLGANSEFGVSQDDWFRERDNRNSGR